MSTGNTYRPNLDRDHTYLRTDDDLLFCVSGDSHTKDSIYGMPYYMATSQLEDVLGTSAQEQIIVKGKEYSKILGHIALDEYPNFIRENLPDYFYGPEGWNVLMKVDRDKVRDVYDPKSIVAKIRRERPLNPDESNPLLHTLHKLEKFSPRLIGSVGITGSLLLTQAIDHRVRNDVDLIFYGEESVEAARAFSEDALQNDPRFSGLSDNELDAYIRKKKVRFGNEMSEDQLKRTVEGRFDTIFVDGVKLDFTFSKSTNKESFNLWDTLEAEDMVSLTGTVVDDSESYYLPTKLKIDNEELSDIVITARGYICLFRDGNAIRVDGQIFTSRKNGERYVVVDEGKGFVALQP